MGRWSTKDVGMLIRILSTFIHIHLNDVVSLEIAKHLALLGFNLCITISISPAIKHYLSDDPLKQLQLLHSKGTFIHCTQCSAKYSCNNTKGLYKCYFTYEYRGGIYYAIIKQNNQDYIHCITDYINKYAKGTSKYEFVDNSLVQYNTSTKVEKQNTILEELMFGSLIAKEIVKYVLGDQKQQYCIKAFSIDFTEIIYNSNI